jgi:glycosyltransferase involved in cell wall biosynthesis
VGDGRWVVPPRDPTALGERLAALARLAPQERERLGAEQGEQVRRRFSWAAMVDAHEALYARVYASQGRPANQS